MKRTLVAVMVGLGAALAAGHVAPSVGLAKCPSSNPNCHSDSVAVPRSGVFEVVVRGTGIELIGHAHNTHGHVLVAASKTPLHQHPRGAQPFTLTASGRFPALKLKLSGGKLYRLSLSNNHWTRIGAITHPGVYAARFG